MAIQTFADVVHRAHAEIVEENDDAVLKALEADLEDADARYEAAEARYQAACGWVEKELARPLVGEQRDPRATVNSVEKDVDDEGKIARSAAQKVDKVAKESHGEKNTSARPPKEVSRDKWEAKHAAQGRVRELTKKNKQQDRRRARDSKYLSAEVDNSEAEVPTASTTPTIAPEEKPGELLAIIAGAQKTANRLKCLKDLPNPCSNRAALLKIMTGGRDNYFCCDPSEVLLDLEERSLVDADLASALMKLLNDVAPLQGPPVPPEQWLAHAKTIASVLRSDEQPLTEEEFLYLKSVDEKYLKEAETELFVAESQLMELVELSETWFPEKELGSETALERKVSGEVMVDLDNAASLEAKAEPKVESRGSKNTSALPAKVVSKERWLANRGAQQRQREQAVKARQARRAACLDRKLGAADVPDNA